MRPCQFIGGSGCSIYEQRPTSCRTFHCWWLSQPKMVDPAQDLKDRPDKIGVVIDRQDTAFGPALTVFPITPNSFDRDETRAYIDELAKSHVVIVRTEPRVVLGPPEKKAKLARIAEAVKRKHGVA